MRKTDKRQPQKARGANARNPVASAWHEAAIRYWLYFERVYPKGPRYRMVQETLAHVEGVTIGSAGKARPLSFGTLKRTLKNLAPKTRKWKKLYAKAQPDELLDFDIGCIPTPDDVAMMARHLSMTAEQAAIVEAATDTINAALRDFERSWRKAGKPAPSLPPTLWLLEKLARSR